MVALLSGLYYPLLDYQGSRAYIIVHQEPSFTLPPIVCSLGIRYCSLNHRKRLHSQGSFHLTLPQVVYLRLYLISTLVPVTFGCVFAYYSVTGHLILPELYIWQIFTGAPSQYPHGHPSRIQRRTLRSPRPRLEQITSEEFVGIAASDAIFGCSLQGLCV